MAKSRTTTATAVEEPIVEQNVETTTVVEEPQTVSEEPQTVSEEPTVVEEPTENTGEGTIEEGNDEGTPQTTEDNGNNESNNDVPVENPLVDKFVKMSGINQPYAENIMKLPNVDYYIPAGSGVDMTKRQELLNQIKEANNKAE